MELYVFEIFTNNDYELHEDIPVSEIAKEMGNLILTKTKTRILLKQDQSFGANIQIPLRFLLFYNGENSQMNAIARTYHLFKRFNKHRLGHLIKNPALMALFGFYRGKAAARINAQDKLRR